MPDIHSPGASKPADRAHSLPLWQLLAHCAQAVSAVQAGRSLTDALDACPPAARPGTQALSFAVMRQLGLAAALRGLLVTRKPTPWVDGLLTSALALACGEQYPAHTLVDQAVNAAKRKAPAASGLVNAVLRRFLRERDALVTQAQQDPQARWNHPLWWIKQLQADWPDHWQSLLEANQHPAPLMLRVNTRLQDRAAYQAQLQALGLASTAFGGEGLTLEQAVPVHQLPGFADGHVSVQDASAQCAAPLLIESGLQANARVLDACSAPGGKTAHLLEMIDVRMLALDSDAQRLVRVDDTLRRLKLQAHTQAADAAQPDQWWDGQPFDAILLDAPCSASGIVRRHPDVRWLRRATDIDTLAGIQAKLLDALWPLLAPGGALLYCTCSVFKREGQEVIDAFLQRQAAAIRLPGPGHLLPVVECPQGVPSTLGIGGPAPQSNKLGLAGDGFFYAPLRKPALASS